MIAKEEVKHIAKLARLELTAEEVEKMQKDLSSILDYFNLLKKAPKGKLDGQTLLRSFNDGASEGQARKDESVITDHGVTKKIIESFPDKKDDYIKVKTIL